MPARPFLSVLLAVVALAASGCGDGGDPPPGAPAADAAAPQPATSESTEPAAAVAPSPGTWTTGLDLSVVRSDGTRIVGLTQPGSGVPAEAVALSPADGAEVWTAPLPAPDRATIDEPSLRFDPGAPVVVSYQATTSGSGLTPAGTTTHVVALDPETGAVLWEKSAGGAAVGSSMTAVLVAARDDESRNTSALALDPVTGKTLWTSDAEPLLVQDDVAVLETRRGVSKVLTGADARTGKLLWSSDAWNPDAFGSRSFLHASVPGRAVIETTASRLKGDTTTVRIRDLRTGDPVGDQLPAAQQVASLVDPATGTIVLDDGSGAASRLHGVYAVDAATGRVLWQLGKEQSTGALAAGAGLVWLQGADGAVAVDAVTGKPRAQALPAAPVLVLPDAQILRNGTGLRSAPLP